MSDVRDPVAPILLPGRSATVPRSVWVFAQYASTPRMAMGMRHYSLARGLVERGLDVTIFAADFSHSRRVGTTRMGRSIARVEDVDGVRFVWLRTFPYQGNDWRRQVNMLSYATLAVVAGFARSKPDVIIGTTVHPFAALAGWVVSASRRTRFMYEVRDLWPQTLIDLEALSPRSAGARLLWAIESFLTRRAEAVISVLPRMPAYLESRGLPAHHVCYLPNGPDIGDFDAARARVLAHPSPAIEALAEASRSRRRAGETLFVYTGSHGRVNRLDVVLEALDIVNRRGGSRISIAFVGDGPNKRELIERARTMHLDNAIFYDPVPKGELPALLSLMDVGIVHTTRTPVYQYGISFNKLFDYMAAGLPVAFATETAADPVEACGGGITLPPDDPEALASAMIELAQLGDAGRRRMGKRGRRFVEQEHDMAVLGERFAALLGVPVDRAA